ncbi:MAG: dTMP kinase [Nitrospiraceae bacterium]
MSSPHQQTRGSFITLEGIEGSGKSTQGSRLCQMLADNGYHVLLTREPGGTPIAEQLRGILLDRPAEPIAPETEALLILAARRQHIDQVIKPALEKGTTVLCDRFSDSTLAYQGYGRGLDLTVLRKLNEWATGGLTPDLTLLFDVPVTVGLTRRQRDTSLQNRLDRETERFHREVRAGFLQLAKRNPRRIRIVKATAPPDTIARAVNDLVLTWLNTRGSKNRIRR